jgi:hypothetical protein
MIWNNYLGNNYFIIQNVYQYENIFMNKLSFQLNYQSKKFSMGKEIHIKHAKNFITQSSFILVVWMGFLIQSSFTLVVWMGFLTQSSFTLVIQMGFLTQSSFNLVVWMEFLTQSLFTLVVWMALWYYLKMLMPRPNFSELG